MEEGRGPALRVVSTFPEPGAGTECSPSGDPDCGVERNTSIQIRFDRFLHPATAVRQSIRLFSGTTDDAEFLEPTYDVVERVLVYETTRILAPGTLYTVELVSPAEPDADGFRAFDGARLEGPEGGSFRFNFQTRRAEPPPPPGRAPPPTCDEALSGPLATCATCHRRPLVADADCPPGEYTLDGTCVVLPRMGLRLDSRNGLASSAIDHVAHQTEVGPVAEMPLSNPSRFGVQMPIVESGKPGNSYLVYKLLANPVNWFEPDDAGCATRDSGGCSVSSCWDAPVDASSPDGCPQPSPWERQRLRNHFLKGEPMPAGGFALDVEQMRTLQRWITALGTPSSPARCE